jgi:hypothetical protein
VWTNQQQARGGMKDFAKELSKLGKSGQIQAKRNWHNPEGFGFQDGEGMVRVLSVLVP